MFRLAHLSDPHLGPMPKATALELTSQRIIGHINWQNNRAKTHTSTYLKALVHDMKRQVPDHIAVTGDLVNLALDEELASARQWLQDLGNSQDVSVVPGNHDAYVYGALAKAEVAWSPFMTGDGHPPTMRPLYPYVRIRGPIAIIGVCSARATPPFMATGYISEQQANHLTELLSHLEEENLFRVVIVHHPPVKGSTLWYKRFIAASRFRKAISQSGAELILHGHTHLATRMSLPGKDKDVPVICAPAASNAPGGHKPAARYNLFEISGEPGRWSCTMEERGFSDQASKAVTTLGQKILL